MDIEYAKLFTSFLTPVVILVLGIWAKGLATEHAKLVSLNERIIEKRVQIYELIGKDLNDIYAFLLQVGQWKELSPADIIKKKRSVDKIMHINRPYWSNSAFNSYSEFMKAGFETWTGIGEDAKIRAYQGQFEKLAHWNDDWATYFSHQEPDIAAIKQSYSKLMWVFSSQFGFIQK